MKKKVFILALAIFPCLTYGVNNYSFSKNADSTIAAKTDSVPKKWKIKNRLILTGEEAYYNNWAKDGFNSLAFAAYYLGKYDYKWEKTKWENSVELGYGILNQDLNNDGKFNDYKHPQKSDDKFILISAYNRKAFGNWYYNANVDFRSQFTKTHKADSILTANIFAPAYLLGSIGMNYEKSGFTALLSFLSNRNTFVMNTDLGPLYGLPVGDKALFEFGSYAKFTYNKNIFKNVNLLTKLELFYDYRKNLFRETSVNWELFINMKVNKYLSAFFNTQLIFDANISKQAQFKERLGLMISFDF